MTLKFIGHPSQGLPGIPARDLDDAEVRALPYTQKQLEASGLYEKVADDSKAKKSEAAASNEESK